MLSQEVKVLLIIHLFAVDVAFLQNIDDDCPHLIMKSEKSVFFTLDVNTVSLIALHFLLYLNVDVAILSIRVAGFRLISYLKLIVKALLYG